MALTSRTASKEEIPHLDRLLQLVVAVVDTMPGPLLLAVAVVELPATPMALEPGRRARLVKDMPVEMDRVISVAVAAELEQLVRMVEQWQTKPEMAAMVLLLRLLDLRSILEEEAAALRTEA